MHMPRCFIAIGLLHRRLLGVEIKYNKAIVLSV
jgi:hypothetical protein